MLYLFTYNYGRKEQVRQAPIKEFMKRKMGASNKRIKSYFLQLATRSKLRKVQSKK